MDKFQIVLADCPWSYSDPSLNRGGAQRHYSTMSVAEICALPVRSIAAKDCALFLWVTFPKLEEIFRSNLFEAWGGFTFKTVAFVWVKTNNGAEVNQYRLLPEDQLDKAWGMGRWTRSNCEICLLAIKGKMQRKSMSVHQVIYAPVSRHSEKPQEVHKRIVQLMGDLPRVELFARQRCDGWSAWGNEVKSDIKL